jgi:hypothetical protein
LSNLLNTARLVKIGIQRLVLEGASTWPGNVTRNQRRFGSKRLGAIEYAVLRTCVSPDEPSPRVALIETRIEQLSRQPRSSATERRRYLDRRRLFAWDAWAQAAMSAEDLEILVSGLLAWRTGKNLVDALAAVDAGGPPFFGEQQGAWPKRLGQIIQFPSAKELREVVSPQKADLLAAGLQSSMRQACDDLLAIGSLVPWDIRDAMMSYKHGLLWLVPASCPIQTDAIGLGRLREAGDSSFVIARHARTGNLFAGSEDDLNAALGATRVTSELRHFVAEAVVSEVESWHGKWGIALYGDTAEDPAQRSAAAAALAVVA